MDKAWDFFSNPRNLERITPPALGLRIISELPDEMHAGMMIRLRVSPLLGLPMTWLTEITHIEPRRFFIDEQRAGPYRIWHHEHHFREMEDGRVEMRDVVTWQLHFGWLAEPVARWIVRPQVERIFAHREKVIREMFPAAA